MPSYSTTIAPGPAVHDPAGPAVQTHEIGDEVFLTFSDEFLAELCWKDGDDIIWQLGTNGEVSITNPQAEVRRKLRRKVDELLRGGPEL